MVFFSPLPLSIDTGRLTIFPNRFSTRINGFLAIFFADLLCFITYIGGFLAFYYTGHASVSSNPTLLNLFCVVILLKAQTCEIILRQNLIALTFKYFLETQIPEITPLNSPFRLRVYLMHKINPPSSFINLLPENRVERQEILRFLPQSRPVNDMSLVAESSHARVDMQESRTLHTIEINNNCQREYLIYLLTVLRAYSDSNCAIFFNNEEKEPDVFAHLLYQVKQRIRHFQFVVSKDRLVSFYIRVLVFLIYFQSITNWVSFWFVYLDAYNESCAKNVSCVVSLEKANSIRMKMIFTVVLTCLIPIGTWFGQQSFLRSLDAIVRQPRQNINLS